MNLLISMNDYCSSVRDGTHDTPEPTNVGKYLVTSRAVNDNQIDFSQCYFISEKDYDKINKRSKVNQWDVIMTMIGTVGRLYLVKEEPDYAIKNMALFKLENEQRAKWLYYYLSTKAVQSYFDMIASGTSQHFIGLGHLRKLKIVDWNNKSQKIISILEKYDSLIESNNKRIKILGQMAENLYKEWFVRFRFPGHETAEFENGLPKRWEKKALGSFVSFQNGFAFSSDDYIENGKYGIVTIKNVQDKQFDSDNMSYIDEVPKRMPKWCVLQEGDILMSLTGNVARLCIVDKGNYLLNQRVCKVLTHYPFYTYCFLNQEVVYSSLCNIAYGTAQLNLSPILASKMKVIVPSEELIAQFDCVVKPWYDNMLCLRRENKNLSQQRDLLLPRLMSGKLEV